MLKLSFTLHQNLSRKTLEILLVALIFILATLLTIFIINPVEIISRSRDIKRLDDITKIISAVDAYRSKNNWKYPQSLTDITEYLSPLPTDPLTKTLYGYKTNDDQTAFEINTIIESKKHAHYKTSDGGDNPNLYEIGNDLNLIHAGLYNSEGKNPKPKTFSLISPKNNEIIYGQQRDYTCVFHIKLTWEEAEDPGDKVIYYYYLADNITFANPIIVGSSLDTNYEFEHTFDEADCNKIEKSIYWTVIAQDNDKNNTQTSIWNFQLTGHPSLP